MEQLLPNLSAFESYLIAMPAIMIGSILFLGGIILLLEPRKKNDAENAGRNQEGARGSRS
jgi:hypothetical protein